MSIRVALTDRGYQVTAAAFDSVEVIARDEYDELTWREANEVASAVLDAWRPGLELLQGATQPPLF